MARHELQHCIIDPKSHLSPLPGTRLNPNIIHVKLNDVVTEAAARAVTSPFDHMGPRKTGCIMAAFGKDKNNEDVLFVNRHPYEDGSLISTNILAVFEVSPDQKDYSIENFFMTIDKFLGLCANNMMDSMKTGTGECSGYMVVYMVAHLPFYKMIMMRWSITTPITSFVKLSRMYTMALTFAQLKIRFQACFHSRCMDFYKPARRHHYHHYHGGKLGTAIPITQNLQFVGEFADPVFIESFNVRNALIHGTNDPIILGQRHSVELAMYHAGGNYGNHEKGRAGCGFTTFIGLAKLYLGPNNKLAADTDRRQCIVRPEEFNFIVDKDNFEVMDEFYKISAQRYEPFYRF